MAAPYSAGQLLRSDEGLKGRAKLLFAQSPMASWAYIGLGRPRRRSIHRPFA